LNLDTVYLCLVFVAVFAGFQGGRYYFANRLQELGIAASLVLFVAGSWRAAFRLHFDEWKTWTVTPVLLIGGIMGISAVVFTLNYSGNVLYSFFSAREFLLAFLGPGIYLLCRSGLDRDQVMRVVWFALVALMLNYLYFYNTMDLRKAFFSSDHTISNLVTFDEWRGFRLKPPLFALMVAILGSLILLKQAKGFWTVLMALGVIGLGSYIWSIVMFRATLATMLLSVALYPLLMRKRSQLEMVMVFAPLILLLIPGASMMAVDHFLNADGGEVRAKAFAKAVAHIPRHPVFGAGEDSAYGDSYQDIVAPYFFPSDLGLVGTCYKYGFVGVLLYLYMHGKIWVSLWRANMATRNAAGRIDPLIWGFLIFMSAQTFNLMLNPGLAYAQGITLGSLALACAKLESQRYAAAPKPAHKPLQNASQIAATSSTLAADIPRTPTDRGDGQ
jgi:hypothetical protein